MVYDIWYMIYVYTLTRSLKMRPRPQQIGEAVRSTWYKLCTSSTHRLKNVHIVALLFGNGLESGRSRYRWKQLPFTCEKRWPPALFPEMDRNADMCPVPIRFVPSGCQTWLAGKPLIEFDDFPSGNFDEKGISFYFHDISMTFNILSHWHTIIRHYIPPFYTTIIYRH